MRDYVTSSMECCKENTTVNIGCDFNSSCLYAKGLEGKVLVKQCSQAFAFCDGENRADCGVRQQDEKDFRTVLSDTVVKQCSQAFTFSDAETTIEYGVRQQDDKDFRTVLSDSETDTARLGFSASQKQPRKMSRRNERERQRVRMVNMGFANLRNLVPDGRNNKKMSKVETLRSAMEYIRQLKELVDEHDAVNAALSSAFPRAQVHFPPPSYSYESDGSSNPMSPEEEELLDFPLWF